MESSGTLRPFEVEDVHTEQNALKYHIHDSPKSSASVPTGCIERWVHIWTTDSEFELAPFYRTSLFTVPTINFIFLLVSLVVQDSPNAEIWSYLSYCVAPFISVCTAMVAMSRPKRWTKLYEEVLMAFFAILLPLIMAIAIRLKYKSYKSEKQQEFGKDYLQYATIVYSVGAFLLVSIGGPFMAMSVR